MRVLTPDQQLLARYLTELRIPLVDRLLIVAELQEPEATLEMLQHIAKTEERDPAKLSSIASKISQKYNRDME